MSVSKTDYGPYTSQLMRFLSWIDSGELLRFRGTLTSRFYPVESFEEAVSLSQQPTDGYVNWHELRENADAMFHHKGVLNRTEWEPYRLVITELNSVVGDIVEAVCPEQYMEAIDDLISDLTAFAVCFALVGELEPFYTILWQAYEAGGWPCGCPGDASVDPDSILQSDRPIYVFWHKTTV